MLNKVVLPYTIWYTGLDKILRLNLDKGIDAVTNISTKATLNGTAVNDLVSAIFNLTTKSIDITIRSDSRMDVDGEMQISLSYSDAKTHESILVVSVRSHDNISTENPKEVKQTKLTVLNGISYTVGAAEEQVVYSFNLVDRNVTDEFATYGDVKDMLMGLGVTDGGEKDQYTIELEGDNLVLSKENDPSYRKIINLAKYHDEVSGSPLNVEDLKRDILSIVDGKIPNVETLKSDILSEAATKDAQLKVDILHEVDGKIPNGDTIKQEILADVNPRILDKETLKTEILESAGEKDTALKTAILEEVGTRTTANNQSLKQEIMGEVDSKLPNTAVLKENILEEVDTKITTNNQTFKSTVMSEVDSKIPDVSAVKSEILNEVNPRLLDKETLKQEILSAIPTPANYTLTMEGDNLVLGKEGDASYRKVINLSKYHDEVTGQTVDVEQIKKDILASITIPNAETIKEEILQALPAKDEYSIELTEDTLILTKTNDSTYRKEIDLSKYKKTDGNVNLDNLNAEVQSLINTVNSLGSIPKSTKDLEGMVVRSPATYNTDFVNELFNHLPPLTFLKDENSYKVISSYGHEPDTITRTHLTIPFSYLREIPTNTESITIEKILELLKDDAKADVLLQIKEKLGIAVPISPSKLVSNPSVTNGVLKFNTETDAPTVDFTNDFYTKAKVDELLGSSSGSNTPGDNKLISGSGRPDANDHPNHNAPVGTIFVDVNSTNGASVWYKDKTNAWKVIVGDTGWIDLKNINTYDKSKIQIRRINDVVYLKFGGLAYGLFGHIPYSKITSKKEKNKIFRIVDIGGIPIGFRSDDAFIGSIISDVESPGSIVASYYVGGQSDANFIKVLYNSTVPETDVKDLRPQPGVWPVGINQPWPKI